MQNSFIKKLFLEATADMQLEIDLSVKYISKDLGKYISGK